MAIPDSPNPSGCDTIGLYISCSRGPPLSGGDYPQKKHGKAVYTHNGGDFCLQASHRLPVLPCPALLGVFSINQRSRKSETRWPGIRELYQPNRKKVIYPHHLKNSIYHSIHPSSGKKKKGGGTNKTERLTCALCKPRSEIIPREGNFTACYYCNKGRPGRTIRLSTATKSSTCTSQGPGENELQARKKDGRRKIWTTLHSLSTLHS